MRNRSMLLSLLLLFPQFVRAEMQSCPLIARQSYQDIYGSVEKLGKDLKTALGECAKSSDIGSMLNAQSGLEKSASQLKNYWQDPTMVTSDSGNFTNHLTQAISSVSVIGENLSNSTLAKGSCLQSGSTRLKLLNGVNDVISNLAPLALLGGGALVGATAFVPMVAAVGVMAGGAKFLSIMEKNKVDMSADETREMVLRGICEFSKMQQRIVYLNMVQSGNKDAIANELKRRKVAILASLADNSALKLKVLDFDKRTEEMIGLFKQLNDDRLKLQEDIAGFNRNKSPRFQCNYIKELVRSGSENKKAYPFGIVERLREPTFAAVTTRSQQSMIQNHVAIEKEVTTAIPGILVDCAGLGADWLSSTELLLNETDLALEKLQAKFQADLNRESGYPEWISRMGNTVAEKVLLQKLFQVSSVRLEASAPIDLGEMNQRIGKVKHALFANNSILSTGGGSLAFRWIDHTNRLYKDQLKNFKDGYEKLVGDSREMIKMHGKALGFVRNQTNGSDLSILLPQYLSKNEKARQESCESIGVIAENWKVSEIYFKSMELFCEVVNKSVKNHPDVDISVQNTCSGLQRLDGSVKQVPDIIGIRQTSERKQDETRAQLVLERQVQLGCKNSTAQVR